MNFRTAWRGEGQRRSHGCQSGEVGDGYGGAAGGSRRRGGGASQCCCASSSLWRQPTAVMRAAPFPLPSSESRKFTSHLGARSFTVCWKIREKLRGGEGQGAWSDRAEAVAKRHHVSCGTNQSKASLKSAAQRQQLPKAAVKFNMCRPNPRSADSLWVEFVKRAVHAHGDVQVVQRSVLSDLVHHGRHPGSADLRGAAGHGAAHLLDDDAVVAGAVEPQLLQDRPDLQQRQTVAEGEGSEVRQQQARHRIPHSCSRRLTWA